MDPGSDPTTLAADEPLADEVTADEVMADEVIVSVPFRSSSLSTLRTMVAALGADSGFSIDEIDDLRLALDEAAAALLAASSSARRLDVKFSLAPGSLTVTVGSQPPVAEVALDELATGIVHAVVDAASIDGGEVTLVKQATETSSVGGDPHPPTA